jgi:transposase
MADGVLAELSPTFDEMYSRVGRPSIPPERLLKSQILMALYTVRSDRHFCEQLDYNLLFRWFLDMNVDEPTFDASSFSRNRERLLEHDVAGKFFAAVVAQARAAHLMSHEHFTVDGTLIEAWASLKSFRRKDESVKDREPPDDPGNPTVDFRGEKRSNDTHASTTDPESRLARKKGKESKLCYSAHALMENRNGLIADLRLVEANGFAERETALAMLEDHVRPGATVAGDKGYDVESFVERCRKLGVTPHIAQTSDKRRSSAVDGRTTRPPGLRDQPAETEAGRRDLRLDEDHWRFPPISLQGPGALGVRRAHRGLGLQPAPSGQAHRSARVGNDRGRRCRPGTNAEATPRIRTEPVHEPAEPVSQQPVSGPPGPQAHRRRRGARRRTAGAP